MSARLVTAARIWPLVVLFLLVLALPALDWAFGIDKAPQPSDNRALAQWPDTPSDRASLNAWPREVEAWFNDHFGFRNQFIRWHNRWKKSLYKEISGADVLVGREGWMYYSGAYMVENLRGTRTLDAAALERIRLKLEARHRWLAERGIVYAFTVAPNKESIYPEYLPDWLRAGIMSPSGLDQFHAYMREHSDVPVIDLRPALLAAKHLGPLYFRQDSHWNRLGAFVAAQTLLEELQARYPQLPPPVSLAQVQVEVQPAEQSPAGDLARMLGQDPREDQHLEILPRPPLAALQPQPTALAADEVWPAGAEPVHTLNPQGRLHALVFHDSFGEVWQTILGLPFERTQFIYIYLWGKQDAGMAWDSQRVLDHRPHLVIDEMVERALLNLTPASIGAIEVE